MAHLEWFFARVDAQMLLEVVLEPERNGRRLKRELGWVGRKTEIGVNWAGEEVHLLPDEMNTFFLPPKMG